MPEYDVVNYPKPLAPNLTGGEVGREPTDLPSKWPAANHIPEQYTGPHPSPAWINTSPTAGQLAGKAPNDAPATREHPGVPGKPTGGAGLPEMPTAANTQAGAS